MRILIDTQIFILLSEPFRLLTADKVLAQYSELVMTVQGPQIS